MYLICTYNETQHVKPLHHIVRLELHSDALFDPHGFRNEYKLIKIFAKWLNNNIGCEYWNPKSSTTTKNTWGQFNDNKGYTYFRFLKKEDAAYFILVFQRREIIYDSHGMYTMVDG